MLCTGSPRGVAASAADGSALDQQLEAAVERLRLIEAQREAVREQASTSEESDSVATVAETGAVSSGMVHQCSISMLFRVSC